jgi:hypothetical protein
MHPTQNTMLNNRPAEATAVNVDQAQKKDKTSKTNSKFKNLSSMDSEKFVDSGKLIILMTLSKILHSSCEPNNTALSKSIHSRIESNKKQISEEIGRFSGVVFSKRPDISAIFPMDAPDVCLVKRTDGTWSKGLSTTADGMKVWLDKEAGKIVRKHAFVPEKWKWLGYSELVVQVNKEQQKSLEVSTLLYLSENMKEKVIDCLKNITSEKFDTSVVVNAIFQASLEAGPIENKLALPR